MSSDTLLVVNAGSSSLKFHLYRLNEDHTGDDNELEFWFGGQVSGIGSSAPHAKVRDAQGVVMLDQALSADQVPTLKHAQELLTQWVRSQLTKPPVAVGHRIVHGGSALNQSVVIDDDVLNYLEELAPLAPLHQHNNLLPVYVIRDRWPQMLQVACVDTAFHRTQPDLISYYALPLRFHEQGVKRYGFHGLSYQYISEYLAQDYPELHQGRVIVAHLGSGASACIMVNGESRESTMGFTALDGLPMATRPGHLDAGVVLWWLQQQKMTADELQDVLYNQSGLRGLSGFSGDMRELLASDQERAKLAINYYTYRVAEGLAGLCIAAQGVDAIVFTAGVGEHSPEIRAGILQHLSWLGVEVDTLRNQANDTRITTDQSRVSAWVMPTNEELVIARETLKHYQLHTV